MNAAAETVVEVRTGDGTSRDECLNAAVDRLIEVALRGRRHGILVTRLKAGHFTVRLSDEVPFGRTEECDEWDRSS